MMVARGLRIDHSTLADIELVARRSSYRFSCVSRKTVLILLASDIRFATVPMWEPMAITIIFGLLFSLMFNVRFSATNLKVAKWLGFLE